MSDNNINYYFEYNVNKYNKLYQNIENKYKDELLIYENYDNETAHKIFQIIILYYRDRVNGTNIIFSDKLDFIASDNYLIESFKYNYNIYRIKKVIDETFNIFIQYYEIDEIVELIFNKLSKEDIKIIKNIIKEHKINLTESERIHEQYIVLSGFNELFKQDSPFFKNDIDTYKYNIYTLQFFIEHELKKLVPITKINKYVY